MTTKILFECTCSGSLIFRTWLGYSNNVCQRQARDDRWSLEIEPEALGARCAQAEVSARNDERVARLGHADHTFHAGIGVGLLRARSRRVRTLADAASLRVAFRLMHHVKL